MVTSQVVSAKVQETVRAAEQALGAESSRLYQTFDASVRQLQDLAREAFQAKVAGDYSPILAKLEGGQPLNEEEKALLKLLIVGEASYYLQTEDDLENWRNELNRLAEAMAELASSGLDDVDSLLRMHALCREARAVIPDVAFYLREQERLARFENATREPLDPEAAKVLAEVVRGMLTSPDM